LVWPEESRVVSVISSRARVKSSAVSECSHLSVEKNVSAGSVHAIAGDSVLVGVNDQSSVGTSRVQRLAKTKSFGHVALIQCFLSAIITARARGVRALWHTSSKSCNK